MRFCDLFIQYKIKRADIKDRAKFKDLSKRKRIIFSVWVFALVLFIVFFAVSGMFKLLALESIGNHIFWIDFWFFIAVSIIMIIANHVVDKCELSDSLEKHYKPYSEERMEMVRNVLKEYNINYEDDKRIDLLIEEAQIAQAKSDSYAFFKGIINAAKITVAPIIAFVASEIGENLEENELVNYALIVIILIIGAYMILSAIDLILKDSRKEYNLYDDFISDMRQIKIFYSRKNGDGASLDKKDKVNS